MYWKVVSVLIRNIFDLVIDINEKVIILGYDIGNKKMKLVNLFLNYAQFIAYLLHIYYVTERNERNKCLLNEHHLVEDLKAELRFYISLKCNQTRFDDIG